MPSGEAAAAVPVPWRAMSAAVHDPASPVSILCCGRAVPGEKRCFSPHSSPLIQAAQDFLRCWSCPLPWVNRDPLDARTVRTYHDGASSDSGTPKQPRVRAASRQGAAESRQQSCLACNGRGRVLFANPVMSLPYSLLKHEIDFPDWVYLGCFFSEKGKFGKIYYCAGSDEKICLPDVAEPPPAPTLTGSSWGGCPAPTCPPPRVPSGWSHGVIRQCRHPRDTAADSQDTLWRGAEGLAEMLGCKATKSHRAGSLY